MRPLNVFVDDDVNVVHDKEPVVIELVDVYVPELFIDVHVKEPTDIELVDVYVPELFIDVHVIPPNVTFDDVPIDCGNDHVYVDPSLTNITWSAVPAKLYDFNFLALSVKTTLLIVNALN